MVSIRTEPWKSSGTEKQRRYEIEVICRSGDQVGESPLWQPDERALYWVDTRRPAIQRLAADGTHHVWPMPNRLSSINLHAAGGLIAGTQRGFCHFDPISGTATTLADPEAATPDNRLNDGKIDRRGRYWCVSAGPTDDQASGSLFRLDPDLSCHRLDSGFIIGNGLAISPDDRTMIIGDTPAERVYAYDFDLADGRVGNRRLFFSVTDMPWLTDGGTFDADGCYWCALLFDGGIGRFDPTGRLDRLIRLPTSAPTMCSFGGDALDVMYVTTSRLLLSDQIRAGEPEAGSLLAIHGLGVRGVPEPRFGQH